MSITDPLITELKAITLKLTHSAANNSEINDTSEDLLLLCNALENIFRKGIIGHSWDWLEEMKSQMESGSIMKSFNFVRSVEAVKTCPKVKTSVGRLRLLIRYCLIHKCLHVPVEVMVRIYKYNENQYYDKKCSILGDEILGEIFLSVVLQISTLPFKLDVSNARFLDNTFVLPQCVQIEFVPCNSLGITVSFIDDKAVVVQVDEKSVAAEDNQVLVGDVLDEINGQVLKTEMKGKLNKIMSKCKAMPVSVKLIKAINNEDKSIYPPIKPLLRKADLDVQNPKNNILNEEFKETRMPPIIRGSPKVNYVGKVPIGSQGDVKQIEYAVSSLLSEKSSIEPVAVYFECQELCLKIISMTTGKILLQNAFMEISACGQTRRNPNFFAYIAGNDICNVATKYTCFVFQTQNDNDIQTILQSIGQGFQRTHYAV